MFKEISIKELKLNPFSDFGNNWMALCAGNQENGYNAMTIAWDHFGSLWERNTHVNRLPTAICYVRPTRYTKEFIDKNDFFTLSCFDESHKKKLAYLGSHSGRDGDKIKAANLTPIFLDDTTYFKEAKMVYVCKKIYHAPLVADGFTNQELIDFNYPNRDFHEMYIGKIVKILIPEE